MPEAEPPKVFVRNDQGLRWGPIAPATLELLLESGVISGAIQISLDGERFAYPGRFPDLREFVPRELWGETAPAPAPPIAPPPPPAHAAPPVPGPPPRGAAPIAGPGARAAAGAAAAPRATTAPGKPVPESLGRAVAPPPPSDVAPEPRSFILDPSFAAAPEPRSLIPEPPRPVAPEAPRPVVPEPPREASADRSRGEARRGPPPSGDLSSLSPIRLYYLAASSDATGLLTLHLPERRVEVHFRKGNPEHVCSSHPEDAVAGFLLREGLAEPGQIAEAELALDRFGGDLVAAMFGLGILNPTTAFSTLARRAQSILFKGLLAHAGRFEFAPADLPAHKVLPLGNRWGVLMEMARRVPPPEVRRRIADAVDLPIMKSGGQVAIPDLRLTPQETRAISHFDGVRSLAMLASDLPQDADTFFRLGWVLRELDVVSFSSFRLEPPPGPTAATAPPAPAPARPEAPPRVAPKAAPPTTPPKAGPKAAPRAAPAAPKPSAPVDPAAELRACSELAGRLKELNHFELLGVKPDAEANAIRIAYFRLAKQYHPDTVSADAPPELAKLKSEIFTAVGAAYRVLADDAARERYVEELRTGVGEVDVARLFQAEEYFQRGCNLVRARRFAEAVTALTEAIALNPEEPDFYAWRGAAKFYGAADPAQGRTEAEADFGTALARNPRCAQAFFFSGQIARSLGDAGAALKHFQKVLELQPDHVDAQREIRYLKK